MKFVTREHARIDRIACPWLIRRFVDPDAEITWVPAAEVEGVASATGAVAFDVPGAELGHHGDRCSFDAMVAAFGLEGDAALSRLAGIVRAADTDQLNAAPEASGLLAIASGFWSMDLSDEERLAAQTPLYDALYVSCGGPPRGEASCRARRPLIEAAKSGALPGEAKLRLQLLGFADRGELPPKLGVSPPQFEFDHACFEEFWLNHCDVSL